MSVWALFTIDLLATALVCMAFTQGFRLCRRLLGREGSGGSGEGMPWRYSPFRPGGAPDARGSGRRPPERRDGMARPARRAPH